MPNDDDLEVAEGDVLKGIEDELLWRVDFLGFVLLFHELKDLLEGWTLEIVGKGVLPISELRNK